MLCLDDDFGILERQVTSRACLRWTALGPFCRSRGDMRHTARCYLVVVRNVSVPNLSHTSPVQAHGPALLAGAARRRERRLMRLCAATRMSPPGSKPAVISALVLGLRYLSHPIVRADFVAKVFLHS
jgi:hypothetical protein